MKTSPAVRALEAADLDSAAQLLAARFREERRTFPILPARFESENACREQLGQVRGYSEHCLGAFDGETLMGFVSGVDLLVSPDSPSARYGAPRSTMLFAHGHAALPGRAADAYHALFAEVAQRCVLRGIFEHAAHIPAGTPEAEAAWFDLGFGRSAAVAARDTNPGRDASSSAFQIRAGTPDDLDSVVRLVDEESRFHATSPIFRPYVSRDVAHNVRDQLRAALGDEQQALLIARRNATDVGILSVGPARGSPLYIPDDACYIGDTAVLDGWRGGGACAALLERGLAWARERGFRNVTLHYSTANALSRAFWTGQGFVPVMYHLRRSIDRRIAWAVPSREDLP